VETGVHALEVPGYGTFKVRRRTLDLELQIAVERDRLLREHLKRNNQLNKADVPLTMADLDATTKNFFTYLATFTQTVEEYPADRFDPHSFLTEWASDEAVEFLTKYIEALAQLEQSFRRRLEPVASGAAVEVDPAADRPRVDPAGTPRARRAREAGLADRLSS